MIHVKESPLKHQLEKLPILIVNPVYQCDCCCIMCDYWRSTDKTRLAVEDIHRLLPECRALCVEQIVFSGGEPLLHPDLRDLCGMFHDAGIRVTLLTNGLRLADRARELLPVCDDFIVSVDGPREVHNAIRRVPEAYEKLRDGIRTLRVMDENVDISGRCTVQKQNASHLCDTVDTARELGLNRISFLAADLQSTAFNRDAEGGKFFAGDLALNRDELLALQVQIETLEQDYQDSLDSGFISETSTKLRQRVLRYYSAALGLEDYPDVPCNAPWVSAVLEADGMVRPCFFHEPYGNIFTDGGLQNAVNSTAAVAWRESHVSNRRETCRTCVCSLNLRPKSKPQKAGSS